MKSIPLLCLLFFTFPAMAKCQKLHLEPIKDANQLAETMGKLKIFNTELMMKYNDDEEIPTGEVILLTSDLGAQQVLQGLKVANKYTYRPKGLPLIEAKIEVKNKVVLIGGSKQQFCLVSKSDF